jgi:hypothetical protein
VSHLKEGLEFIAREQVDSVGANCCFLRATTSGHKGRELDTKSKQF